MKSDWLEIKNGLRYQLSASASLQEDFVAIKDFEDSLHFCFQYSGVECVVVDPDNPLSSNLIFDVSKGFLENIEVGFSDKLSELNRTDLCCNMQVHLHEILKSKNKGVRQRVFVESKFLQLLLCIEEEAKSNNQDCSNCKFLSRPEERLKLERALSILNESIGKSITIPSLSRQVGINECYLKKGFKEMFGKTIFMHLQELRMQRAKVLLKEEVSVTEVAAEVGYASISSFSTAFKKKVGVLPTEYVV
jgi:AraC-like DNA-binding protein